MPAELILRNFNVITMDGREQAYGLIRNATVVVQDEKITWVGDTQEFDKEIPAGDSLNVL